MLSVSLSLFSLPLSLLSPYLSLFSLSSLSLSLSPDTSTLSLSSLSLSLFLVAYLSPSAAQEMIESVPGSSTRSYLFVREW